jgi:outer membrane protein, heavy metal efflux system
MKQYENGYPAGLTPEPTPISSRQPGLLFRMRFLWTVIFFCGLLVPFVGTGISQAQDIEAPDTLRSLNLDEIIASIRALNPDLATARLTTEALGTKSEQVSALPDPTVGLNVLPFPLYTARGKQLAQFKVEQKIPFPGKLGLMGEIADYTSQIAGSQTDALANNLEYQAKQAYYELYRIQRYVSLIHDFEDRLRDFESVAATQYEVGRGLQQSIIKAQLERNTLSKQLLDLSRLKQTALETLSRLTNRPVARSIDTLLTIATPGIPSIENAALLDLAKRLRPESQALATAQDRADTGILLAKKKFLPDFGVNFTYFDIGTSDIPPGADGRNALGIGISVVVPLQRGRLQSQLEEARLLRNRVETNIESLYTGFETRISDLVSRLTEDDRQLRLYSVALIPQAQTTLSVTVSAYTTGRIDFLNLLDAERMLFTLHLGYEDTYARYLKTVAALEQALGVTSLDQLSSNQ